MIQPDDSFSNFFTEENLIFLGVSHLDNYQQNYQYFLEWLNGENYIGMPYLKNYAEVRKDPLLCQDKTKSILSFAWDYSSLEAQAKTSHKVARYARLVDYHKELIKRGNKVIRKIQSYYNLAEDWGRVVVDSAPVLERAIAADTKQGFFGKNNLYIHPKRGSFLLLAEIFSTYEFKKDLPSQVEKTKRTELGGCGSCKRCQLHCPTGALDKAYSIDARRCLSYWTIEHRGVIPLEFWKFIPEYFFGCDKCQDVCPYNRNLASDDLSRHIKIHNIDFFEIATMDQRKYESLFGGTPMTRAKKIGLMRNALIVLCVTKDSRFKLAKDYVSKINEPVLIETLIQAKEYNQTT